MIQRFIRNHHGNANVLDPIARADADVVFTLDRTSKRYVRYAELTPGALVLASCEFYDRAYPDVVPSDVAELMHRAIYNARIQGTTQRFTYVLRRHHRQAHLATRGDAVVVAVRELPAVP